MILSLEETFTVGQETYFDSASPLSSFAVTFEDDMTTGYFYAADTESEFRILDAVHIYNVADVTDKEKPCNIKIVWNNKGLSACLLINDYCHAIFDFVAKAGYSRTGFPEANSDWCKIKERLLTDDLINSFIKKDA